MQESIELLAAREWSLLERIRERAPRNKGLPILIRFSSAKVALIAAGRRLGREKAFGCTSTGMSWGLAGVDSSARISGGSAEAGEIRGGIKDADSTTAWDTAVGNPAEDTFLSGAARTERAGFTSWILWAGAQFVPDLRRIKRGFRLNGCSRCHALLSLSAELAALRSCCLHKTRAAELP